MKERPILFSAPMVRATLEGRKTQTRRIVKPSTRKQSEWLTENLLNSVPHGKIINSGWQMHHPLSGTVIHGLKIEEESPLGWIKCPYGQVGDQLWVRETWAYSPDGDGSKSSEQCLFDADDEIVGLKKIPSIHMPRWASRIQLEITDIRVERLQDISQDDACAEGVQFEWDGRVPVYTARSAFRDLWSSINGTESWDKNSWVWVIEFRRIK